MERPQFNVLEHGAKGDGTSDDGPAIQAAIDSAAVYGSGLVYLPHPKRWYKITASLHLKSGITLYGDGIDSRIFFVPSGGAVIDVDDQSDFRIHHLRISGSGMLAKESTFGINIHNGSHNGTISDCLIDEHYLGIAVQGVHEKDVTQISILNNTIIRTGLNPVGINTRGKDISVTGNTLDTFGSAGTLDNIAAGIEMRGVIGGTISSDTIRNGSSHWGAPVVDGVRLEYLTESPDRNPQHIECSGNVIDSVGGYGIRAIYSRHCLITRNKLLALGTGGVYLVSSNSPRKTCDSNTISYNQIDRAHDGIFLESTHAGGTNHLYQCTSNVITGNRIDHSYQYGIHIWGGSNNTIASNQISQCGNIGIYQHGGSNNTYKDNRIMNAAFGARVPLPACFVSGDTNNVFTNTLIVKSDSLSRQTGEIKIGEHAVRTIAAPMKSDSLR